MYICLPNISLSEEDTLFLISRILKSWTEIPLSSTAGYDKEELKFYDGFLGTLIRRTEASIKEWPQCAEDDFIKSWKYQGPLYRVLHASPHNDRRYRDGFRMELPSVEYHRMITHWTNDFTFNGLLYKLSPKQKCIILEAHTGNHIAFDVNRFRDTFGFQERYTEKEREIIFPMYKECITEYRMTIEEFAEMKTRS